MLRPGPRGAHARRERNGVISTVEKVIFLKGVDLFKSIPGEDLSHIAQITDEIEFGPSQMIFKEGDQGDAMYLIVDGKVRVHSGEQVFAELGQKQCFGEMAILDAEPRSASVTALSDLTLLKIQRDDFTEILAEKPEISQGIIKVLTRRLREANRR
jgi:CRP/FNR family cyclic AMP-dependent transcriptional regulator